MTVFRKILADLLEVPSAAAYGELDPIAPNGTNENRQKNRRIEIPLETNIHELVAVPTTP
jgi:flagellar motor protein MotB